MLKYNIPKYKAQMKELAELFEAEQPEIDLLEKILEDMLKQLYVKSAHYAIEIWEQEFGIVRDKSLTITQRRAQVLAKMNISTPASVQMLENLVMQVLTANKVTIIEHPETYSFDIYVNSKYIIENMKIAENAVYEARPAHLSYKFINEMIREAKSFIYFGIMASKRKRFIGEVLEIAVSDNK